MVRMNADRVSFLLRDIRHVKFYSISQGECRVAKYSFSLFIISASQHTDRSLSGVEVLEIGASG